ncbi:MAG: DUF1566 domain-containing protein [Candidatus Lernaella stagnicola]|nr:DUF1566 domain-containing protein [Candidatus Lernaella stagnicola]
MKRTAWFWMALLLIPALLLAGACGDDDDDTADDDDNNDNDDDTAGDDDNNDNDDDAAEYDYPIVDTNQTTCYGNASAIGCPSANGSFFGQDAQVDGPQPAYEDNGDGTVTDLVTGLMWQQDPGDKMSFGEAAAGAESFSLAGYDDWRLPTIKELYSLILFSGVDPSGYEGSDTSGLVPFIDDEAFSFAYGDTGSGQRIIDSQWVTSSTYVATVMGGNECFFGVNFADGRIKCYPTANSPSGYFTIYVRDTGAYGANSFHDNGNDTVADDATGLIWQQDDSQQGMVWEDALAYCEDLELGDRDDWRLPNAKELQSIVDYDRSPDTTSSAATDPVFNVSSITNEAGQTDFPFFWTSTTHANFTTDHDGANAVYVAFGRALGYMDGNWIDVHGAGAQRSDPKEGDPADYPEGHGPQGDAIRIFNYVRCVCDDPNAGVGDDDDDDNNDDNDDNDDDSTPPGEPPQEAIDACNDKDEGDDCEFEAPEGTLTGTCEIREELLVCVPEGAPPPPLPAFEN